MSNSLRVPFHLRIAAAMLVAVLTGGCYERLSQKHEYFSPLRGTSSKVTTETERVLRYYAELQAARRACAAAGTSVGASQGTVAPGGLRCAPPQRTRAAYGSALNAYRRWAEDNVRQLPNPSETASSISN